MLVELDVFRHSYRNWRIQYIIWTRINLLDLNHKCSTFNWKNLSTDFMWVSHIAVMYICKPINWLSQHFLSLYKITYANHDMLYKAIFVFVDILINIIIFNVRNLDCRVDYLCIKFVPSCQNSGYEFRFRYLPIQ